MCSCEGKQIQSLFENSSRQCQKPTSCIFAKNPHAPCFPSGGARWGDCRHHGMAWEEMFEDSWAEPFLQLLGARRWAGLCIPCHPAEPLLVGPGAGTGPGSVVPSTHGGCGSHGAGLPFLSCRQELLQVPAPNQLGCLRETFPERHCAASQLDYLWNMSLVGRKVHIFHQFSAIRICQLWEICSLNKWLGHQELRGRKPEVIVPKHLLLSL